MLRYRVFVISAGRPESVKKMQSWLARPCTWIVRPQEVNDYKAQGALSVVSTVGLIAARNLALDLAFAEELACVQISDDLMQVKYVVDMEYVNSAALEKRSSFKRVMDEFTKVQAETGAYLVGASPTGNALNVTREISTNKFIIGDLFLCMPTDLRFDTKMRLKEDYDFTLQHIAKYGKVARAERILPIFKHYDNPGGAVAYRNAQLEQEMIAYLKQKWPDKIRDNTKRANEIIII